MLPKLFVETKLWKTPDSKRKKHPVLNLYNPRKVFRDSGYGGVCVKRYEFDIVPGLSVWQKKSQGSLASYNSDDDTDYAKCEAHIDALDSVTTLDQYIDLCAADERPQHQSEETYENKEQRKFKDEANIVDFEQIQIPRREYITREQYTQVMLLNTEETPIIDQYLSESIVPTKSQIKPKSVKKKISFKFVQTDRHEEPKKSELKLELKKDTFDQKLSSLIYATRFVQTERFGELQMPELKLEMENNVFDNKISTLVCSSSLSPIIDTHSGIESNLSSLLSYKFTRKTEKIYSKSSDLDFETCRESPPSKVSSETLPFESISLCESNNCICKESRSSMLHFGNDDMSGTHVNIHCPNCVTPDTEKEINIVSRQVEDLCYCNAGELAPTESYSCVLQDAQITANDEPNNGETYLEGSCDFVKLANDSIEVLIKPNRQVCNTGISTSTFSCDFVIPPSEEVDFNLMIKERNSLDLNEIDTNSINIKDTLSNTKDLIYHTSANPITEVLSINHKTVIEEVENIRNKVNILNYTISNVEKLITKVEQKVPNPTLCITTQHDSFLLGLQQKILDDFHTQVQCNRTATEGALEVIEQFEQLFGEANTKKCLEEKDATTSKTGCTQLKYVEKLQEEKEKKTQIFINECKQGIIFKEIKQLEEIQNNLFRVQDYIEKIAFN